ncbi:MAG: ion transporter [Gammaproteobacteria bacterium]|nr:ion transporter [Gammaproteobacteria bacterium]MDE0251709.1 ion transporter [Gammaproteobacteria bacterium]MDE0403281.1 ion transporter [Gammaproteobacteria bacterium]
MKKLGLIVAPLILVSLASLILSTEVQDADLLRLLKYVEFSLGILFSIEYVVRIAHGKFKYARSFFGVIDAIAALSGVLILVVPSSFLALRVLRLLSIQSIEIRQSQRNQGLPCIFK